MSEIRAARLADLKAKLKLRDGKPGMAANVEAIKKQISDLEAEATYRDSTSGVFVSIEHALQNPETTEVVNDAD